MTDAFAEIVMPIFRKAIDLQGGLARGESRTLDDVKRMASGWVEDARRRATGFPGPQRSFELARYGLVAWIDESLTASEWGRAMGSPEAILEWDLFSSRERASLFYSHSERAEDEGDLDALETYLLCVTLGFRGDLVYDDVQLADWVHRVYVRISGGSSVPDRPFAEEPARHPAFGPLRGPSLLVTVSVLVSITALVTLVAYLCAVHFQYSAEDAGNSVSRLSGDPVQLAAGFQAISRPDVIGSERNGDGVG